MIAPLRIALIILDGAGIGGTERHVHSLVTQLPERDFEVHLVTSADGPLVDAAQARGVATQVIPRYPAARYVWALARCLRRVRPDIAHAHSGRLACAAARLARVPFVFETRHGLGDISDSRLFARWEGLKSRMLVDRTIAVCGADARWLEAAAGLPSALVAKIPNGVSARSSDPSVSTAEREADPEQEIAGTAADGSDLVRPPRVLGFVGRFSRQKEPERVIALFQALTKREDWEAILCGDGPLRASLEAQARLAGVAERITWTGPVRSAYPILASLDLLCLPSRWEGLPYVLLEALSEGVPVLATPVGGVPDLLGGPVLSAGCMTWDLGAWTKRAREVSDPAVRENWSRSARGAADYSETAMLDSLASLYRVSSRKRTPRTMGHP